MEEDDYFDDFDDSILGAMDLELNTTNKTTGSSSKHNATKQIVKPFAKAAVIKPKPIIKRSVSKSSTDSTRQTTFKEFKTHEKFVPQLKFHIPVIPDHKPTYHKTDPEALKTWIYPTNYPKRDYQHAICQSALFSNTLVCLPTGLGKTFIAAVVMFNFFRWFPKSKIVFLAPTKPLVNQQIDACYKIVGIPAVYIF
jgi:ATP-dependent DNA helicase MPH1